MAYRVKAPWILTNVLYKRLTWSMPANGEQTVYLTFDDGPHPEATPYVLEQLSKYNAKGTFFCIGKNVAQYPDIYNRIITEGHAVGNHTQNHLNGWRTPNSDYINNITEATQYINSKRFRPPYGRIKYAQINLLLSQAAPCRIYMWDVLSGDFDTSISPEKCADNVIRNIKPGSIVVFHDSSKAWDRMHYALPETLKFIRSKNWQTKTLP